MKANVGQCFNITFMCLLSLIQKTTGVNRDQQTNSKLRNNEMVEFFEQ